MSILITGIDMPTKGNPITVLIYPDGTAEWEAQNKVGTAIPVLKHGKLIDADDYEVLIRRRRDNSSVDANATAAKGGSQVITTKDKIGYIRRQENPDGTTTFKLIEAKIKSIRIGKKGTSVYSDRFRALDAEELEDNTEIMSGNSALVLVGEPFITNEEMSEGLKKVVDHWNKHGAETLLGNRTEPPKEEVSDV